MTANSDIFGTIAPLSASLYKIQQQAHTNLKISGKLDEVNNLRLSVIKQEPILFTV